MREKAASFLYSVLGGVCIGIGGVVFLSCENKVVGAVFFCLGLFAICTFGFNLFTGKVGYVFEQPLSYTGFVLSVWLGNLVGTALVGYAVRATRIAAAIVPKAESLCQAKLEDGLGSIFILSVLCNILMFIAVDGFRNNPHQAGKYIGIFLGVTVFILCGFEHCVANMYYIPAGIFALADPAYAEALAGLNTASVTWAGLAANLIPVTLGNILGGAGLGLAYWYIYLKKPKA